MKKLISTGKYRKVEIKKIEYYCDKCGKLLGKDNHKAEYWNGSFTTQVCKYSKNCNVFYKEHL